MKAIVVKVFVLVGLFMFVGMIARAQAPAHEPQEVPNVQKQVEHRETAKMNGPVVKKSEKKIPMRRQYHQAVQVEKSEAPLYKK